MARGSASIISEALLEHLLAASLTECKKACHMSPKCQFYQYMTSGEGCSLFERCDSMQYVGIAGFVNELYGRAPEGSFCRVADPEACWRTIRRRSLLSLVPSDLPSCSSGFALKAIVLAFPGSSFGQRNDKVQLFTGLLTCFKQLRFVPRAA